MPTSTSHLLSLKKLSIVRIHFWCLKCYKRNFFVLLSVMWMQRSKSDGSNLVMAIGLKKMHYISRYRPSLILHLVIDYQSLHIGHSWKINLLRSFIVLFHLLFNCQHMCCTPHHMDIVIQYLAHNVLYVFLICFICIMHKCVIGEPRFLISELAWYWCKRFIHVHYWDLFRLVAPTLWGFWLILRMHVRQVRRQSVRWII